MHRVSEAKKWTWSNSVLEFGIVSVWMMEYLMMVNDSRDRDSVINENKYDPTPILVKDGKIAMLEQM